MRYMFKDLAITVFRDEAALDPHCGHCSLISCALPTVQCGPVTCPLTSVIHAARNAESLALLKDELQNAIAQVEVAETAVPTKTQPTTVEEAEFIEQQLSAALEEVQRYKESLPGA